MTRGAKGRWAQAPHARRPGALVPRNPGASRQAAWCPRAGQPGGLVPWHLGRREAPASSLPSGPPRIIRTLRRGPGGGTVHSAS